MPCQENLSRCLIPFPLITYIILFNNFSWSPATAHGPRDLELLLPTEVLHTAHTNITHLTRFMTQGCIGQKRRSIPLCYCTTRLVVDCLTLWIDSMASYRTGTAFVVMIISLCRNRSHCDPTMTWIRDTPSCQGSTIRTSPDTWIAWLLYGCTVLHYNSRVSTAE
jgi:hypothetical protein